MTLKTTFVEVKIVSKLWFMIDQLDTHTHTHKVTIGHKSDHKSDDVKQFLCPAVQRHLPTIQVNEINDLFRLAVIRLMFMVAIVLFLFLISTLSSPHAPTRTHTHTQTGNLKKFHPKTRAL